jgi:hypothetical protein
VIKVGGVYHMFYTGWLASSFPSDFHPEDVQIGHATSSDGVHWELDPANPVLRPGVEGAWDHASLEGAAVIHDGSKFQMWYAAVTRTEGGFEASWRGVGYATSPDGSSWLKHQGNPIIQPTAPRVTWSAAGPWLYELSGIPVIPQTVMREGERYRMWFIEPYPSVSRVGYAESADGLAWGAGGPPWDELAGPALTTLPRTVYGGLSVVFDGALYHMVHINWGGWGESDYAASRDGRYWTSYARNPVSGAWLSALTLDDGVFKAWSWNHDGREIYWAKSECCSTVFTWFLMPVAHGAGARGSFFRTEVDVSNAGNTTCEYRFAWFPRGEPVGDRGWTQSGLVTLQPGKSVRYRDVLAEVFGLGQDSFGTLAVEASSGDLRAMGRTYTRPTGATTGTCGQSVPATRMGDFIQKDERRRILFGSEHEGARFNVMCQNAGVWPKEIHLDLFAADGTFLESKTMHVELWSNDQLNGIFSAHSPVSGYVDVWSHSWGEYYCLGFLVDNETSDAITIPPLGR